MREGDEHSPGCSTFFHGNCSVGWTLQQVDPQEREERGNDLNGGKVEQRDRGKERAQAAREEELPEAREDVREGRKSAQIRQQDSEMAGERIKREKVVHSQVSVSLQGHFHICKCGGGPAAEPGLQWGHWSAPPDIWGLLSTFTSQAKGDTLSLKSLQGNFCLATPSTAQAGGKHHQPHPSRSVPFAILCCSARTPKRRIPFSRPGKG